MYWTIFALGFAVIAALLVFVIVRTKRVNSEIEQNGLETGAVVSRVKEDVTYHSDGSVFVNKEYYVRYRTIRGESVEARLGSGKSVVVTEGKKAWDRDLIEGASLRIKYLPDKPNYVIRVS